MATADGFKRAPDYDLDALKSQFPSAIHNRIALQKQDDEHYTGLCPFHNDHKPSFSLNRNAEGIWLCHCFACNFGGSVIDFIMELEGCSFQEAVEICREEADDDLDGPDHQQRPARLAVPQVTAKFSFTEEGLQKYEEALWQTPRDKDIFTFLIYRGVNLDLAKHLRFGLADREFRCGAKVCPHCKKYRALVIPRFWKGQLVGVKYRALEPPDKGHKWSQEPGSAADFLYLADAEPLDPADSESKGGVDPAFKVVVLREDAARIAATAKIVGIFEGELDAVLARSLGFNAVAILGTTGVPSHPSKRFQESLDLLVAKYKHIVLIGDGDATGQEAMRRLEKYIGGTGTLFNPPPYPFKDLGEFLDDERKRNPAKAKSRVAEWLVGVYALAAEGPAMQSPGSPDAKFQATLQKALAEIGKSEVRVIVPALQSELRLLALPETTFPKQLGHAALQGLVGDFVTAALPHTEANAECLAYQFLTAVGNMIGTKQYAPFGADSHYGGLFTLIVGSTATGKGQALSAVKSFVKTVDPFWAEKHCRYSAASGEGLVRLVAEVCGKTIANDQGVEGDDHDDFQDWDTPDLAARHVAQQLEKKLRASQSGDGRLLLIASEMSVLLNSMNREGSNTSGYLRLGYDRAPLENNKSKHRLVARNYLLSVVGHITPDELQEIHSNVDWYNGVSNRFLWAAVKKSKTLPRMSKTPNFAPLAMKLRKLLDLPAAGRVEFSDSGGEKWDEWIQSLPELDGKLGASQERIKANALRVALIYAALDDIRLTFYPKFEIKPDHVDAAIEIVTRSRETIEWFLAGHTQACQNAKRDDITKIRLAINQNGGQLTGEQLYKLFSNKTDNERIAIATAAGLKQRTISTGKRGKPATIWTW